MIVGVQLVGRCYCWRTAMAVMRCHAYNALWTGSPAVVASNLRRPYWFEASWRRRWWGGCRIELREYHGQETGT